jgi:hypothetical protein
MICGPEIDVDGIEDAKKREPPGNAIDDGLLAVWEELVDDGAEEEGVDERPVGGQQVLRMK